MLIAQTSRPYTVEESARTTTLRLKPRTVTGMAARAIDLCVTLARHGTLLAMSGVVGAKKEAVESALHSFAEERGGSFRLTTNTSKDPNTLVLLEDRSGCSLLYPSAFLRWDKASQYLSSQLDAPVFSFHIHDGDLWMFILFDKGEQITQFNPLPEYWDDGISEEERASWSGDAAIIASRIPGIKSEMIAPYLCHWDLDEEDPGKAFPDDEFHFHDCWQMCDFLRKVGLRYPLDNTDRSLGQTYEFTVPEKR